jgi:hypothetical protein
MELNSISSSSNNQDQRAQLQQQQGQQQQQFQRQDFSIPAAAWAATSTRAIPGMQASDSEHDSPAAGCLYHGLEQKEGGTGGARVQGLGGMQQQQPKSSHLSSNNNSSHHLVKIPKAEEGGQCWEVQAALAAAASAVAKMVQQLLQSGGLHGRL